MSTNPYSHITKSRRDSQKSGGCASFSKCISEKIIWDAIPFELKESTEVTK